MLWPLSSLWLLSQPQGFQSFVMYAAQVVLPCCSLISTDVCAVRTSLEINGKHLSLLRRAMQIIILEITIEFRCLWLLSGGRSVSSRLLNGVLTADVSANYRRKNGRNCWTQAAGLSCHCSSHWATTAKPSTILPYVYCTSSTALLESHIHVYLEDHPELENIIIVYLSVRHGKPFFSILLVIY